MCSSDLILGSGTQYHQLKTTVLAPAQLTLSASKSVSSWMFVCLGGGPGGAQKAEGTEKGNAGISPGPRSGRENEKWADGPKWAMWEAWATGKMWAQCGLAKTPISWSALEMNPMPGHLFEGNPVDEGTKRRGLTPSCIVGKARSRIESDMTERC